MIKLSMPVKPITDEDWHLIGNQEGVQLVFVDLQAQERMFYEKTKTKEALFFKPDPNDSPAQRTAKKAHQKLQMAQEICMETAGLTGALHQVEATPPMQPQSK